MSTPEFHQEKFALPYLFPSVPQTMHPTPSYEDPTGGPSLTKESFLNMPYQQHKQPLLQTSFSCSHASSSFPPPSAPESAFTDPYSSSTSTYSPASDSATSPQQIFSYPSFAPRHSPPSFGPRHSLPSFGPRHSPPSYGTIIDITSPEIASPENTSPLLEGHLNQPCCRQCHYYHRDPARRKGGIEREEHRYLSLPRFYSSGTDQESAWREASRLFLYWCLLVAAVGLVWYGVYNIWFWWP